MTLIKFLVAWLSAGCTGGGLLCSNEGAWQEGDPHPLLTYGYYEETYEICEDADGGECRSALDVDAVRMTERVAGDVGDSFCFAEVEAGPERQCGQCCYVFRALGCSIT